MFLKLIVDPTLNLRACVRVRKTNICIVLSCFFLSRMFRSLCEVYFLIREIRFT